MVIFATVAGLFIRSNRKGPDSDKELIHKYRNSHDKNYVGELFQRYTHLVYGVCMKYLKDEDACKDAVMEIFEDLMEKLKRHEVSNFKSWLHTVARNHCLMQLRKEDSASRNLDKYTKSTEDVMETDIPLHLNSDSDANEKALQRLKEGLILLSDEQKKCVELFYYEDKSYAEITEITGYSLKEVKSFLQNGKRNLKNYVANEKAASDGNG